MGNSATVYALCFIGSRSNNLTRRRQGGIGEGGIRKEGFGEVGCEEIILCFKLT
jgi:hypothetical protein